MTYSTCNCCGWVQKDNEEPDFGPEGIPEGWFRVFLNGTAGTEIRLNPFLAAFDRDV